MLNKLFFLAFCIFHWHVMLWCEPAQACVHLPCNPVVCLQFMHSNLGNAAVGLCICFRRQAWLLFLLVCMTVVIRIVSGHDSHCTMALCQQYILSSFVVGNWDQVPYHMAGNMKTDIVHRCAVCTSNCVLCHPHRTSTKIPFRLCCHSFCSQWQILSEVHWLSGLRSAKNKNEIWWTWLLLLRLSRLEHSSIRPSWHYWYECIPETTQECTFWSCLQLTIAGAPGRVV